MCIPRPEAVSGIESIKNAAVRLNPVFKLVRISARCLKSALGYQMDD